MLILRLMAHCNNRCEFCCVREEMARAQDIPIETLKERILEHTADTPIDFFGGEPTLYPHFLEALRFARERGHPCSIATNGRRFSHSAFAKEIAEIGVSQIRTSLYGHNAKVHDYHTGSKASFEQTVRGIENILRENVDLYVNMVITSENYQYLLEMVNFLYGLGVDRVKFGTLINAEHCLNLVPNISKVRLTLEKALDFCLENQIEYVVEKSPLCIAPRHQHAFIYEPDSYLYRKPNSCHECLAKQYCVGLSKEQIQLFGDEAALPFMTYRSLDYDALEEERLNAQRHDFVSWDDDLLPSITVIVKATATCNMACSYCYAAKNFNNVTAMPRETITHLLSQLAATNFARIDINWHGGEPLIAGLPFFQAYCSNEDSGLISQGRTVVNRLQTNGTLINDSWAEFCRESQLEVGVSLDGPGELHDLHRTMLGGRGSYQKVMKGIQVLGKNKVPTTVLSVITADAVDKAGEIYDFLCALPSTVETVHFLPCFEIQPETGHLISSSLDPAEYARFMISLFERWFYADNENLRIPFFEDVLSVFLGGEASLCFFKRGCSGFITVEPNGDVYPCDRFSGLPEFFLGNVNQQKLEDLMKSDRYLGTRAKFRKLPNECLGCDWVKLCRGGCSYEAYALTGDVQQPGYFCDGLKMIFAHIDATLAETIEDYESLFLGLRLLQSH